MSIDKNKIIDLKQIEFIDFLFLLNQLSFIKM